MANPHITQALSFLSAMDSELVNLRTVKPTEIVLETTKHLDAYEYAECVEWVGEVAVIEWGLNSGPHIFIDNPVR